MERARGRRTAARPSSLPPRSAFPWSSRSISAADGKALGGELVVYPDRPVSWEKDVQLLSAGGPDWFDSWSAAVGLPVQRLKGIESLPSNAWPAAEKSALLIVGPQAAGRSPAPLRRLALEKKINVLVLGASWFFLSEAPRDFGARSRPSNWPAPWPIGKTSNGRRPPSFAATATFSGRSFATGRRGSPARSSRWSRTFAARRGADSLRMVLSYLPWQEQLGRCEMADVLFLRLLTETARARRGRPPLDCGWRLLYPPAKDIKAAERPVLAAALQAEAASGEDSARRKGRARRNRRLRPRLARQDAAAPGSVRGGRHENNQEPDRREIAPLDPRRQPCPG